MSRPPSHSRREFLVAGASGVGLLLAVGQLGCRPRRPAEVAKGVQPSQWLRIDPSGQVTVINDKSEMGQGAGTAIPLLVAEELGVGLDLVRVEHAKPGPGFDE